MIEETRKETRFVLALDAVSAQRYLVAHLYAPERETDWVFPTSGDAQRRQSESDWLYGSHRIFEVALEVKAWSTSS